jgi:Domain of unknown function (DUF4386)
VFECTFILVGIVSMLEVITLRQQVASTAEARSPTRLRQSRTGRSCSARAGWSAGGNGLILDYLMYRSGLVPREWCWLGLIGGPLIVITSTAVMVTRNKPSHSLHSLQAILTIPEFAWELFLGV